MLNRTTLFLMISLTYLGGCTVESAPARWQMDRPSNNSLYRAYLDCETAPETGSFQNCTVYFTDDHGAVIAPDTVLVDGGMPLHGHGLPTSPILTALEQTGTYRIDGLKYNMSGAWLLGFKLKTARGSDKVIFDFAI